MSHPEVFFRQAEFEAKKQEYHTLKNKVDAEAENYFANINTVEQLYSRVERLDNKDQIFDLFSSQIMAYETFGEQSKALTTSEVSIDPFYYNPMKSVEVTSPQGMFYIGIGLFVVFLFTLFMKWRISKLIGILLIAAIGFNLYNYYVAEPEFVNSESLIFNPEKYRKAEDSRIANKLFKELYKFKSTQF